MKKVIVDAVPELTTCMAHFMAYYDLKKKQELFEKYNMDLTEMFYFKSYHEDMVRDTQAQYAEYRRQRDILEEKLGYEEVDKVIEIAFREWREKERVREGEQFLMEHQRDRLGCTDCIYAVGEKEGDFCMMFNDGIVPVLFLPSCPAFTKIKEPID